MHPRISLEQWRTLVAVVDAGGYAQAAEALHKSQSTLTYAVQKMEQLLGLQVFQLQGRKAVLTAAGQVLYRRGRALIEEAAKLECAATALAHGWEAELRIAVEIIFPTWLLLESFKRFADEHAEVRLELYESVLGGTEELLENGQVDMAIVSNPPRGFLGDPLVTLKAVAVASPDHPLHTMGRKLTLEDLRHHRHLLIRDSGTQRVRSAGWTGSEQRWTVSHKATSIRAAIMGLGFAWFPVDAIRDELRSGRLKPLPMNQGGERSVTLYLVFADHDAAGLGARRLAEILREDSAGCTSDPQTPVRTG